MPLTELVVPRNTLVVLIGPAGSGKSTFAARHFLATQVVSSDRCRAMICDDANNQRVSEHAFDLVHFVIEKRLRIGRLTVVDATNLERRLRRPLVRIARRYDFNIAAIIFDVPLEVSRARNARRRRVVPDEALDRHQELLIDTLKTIRDEGFNRVWVVNREDQDRVRVRVGRKDDRASQRR